MLLKLPISHAGKIGLRTHLFAFKATLKWLYYGSSLCVAHKGDLRISTNRILIVAQDGHLEHPRQNDNQDKQTQYKVSVA